MSLGYLLSIVMSEQERLLVLMSGVEQNLVLGNFDAHPVHECRLRSSIIVLPCSKASTATAHSLSAWVVFDCIAMLLILVLLQASSNVSQIPH